MLLKKVFKLMNNSIFREIMENKKQHGDIELLTTDKRRNQLVSEPSYHTTKWLPEDLLAIETKKTKVRMNKRVYLGLSVL